MAEPTDSDSSSLLRVSTPFKPGSGSYSDSLAGGRGTILFDDLVKEGKVWQENERAKRSPSMVELVLGCMDDKWEAHADKHLRSIPALYPFIESAGAGKMNEEQFAAVISAVALTLDKEVDIQYVQSGSTPMYPRAKGQKHPEDPEAENRSKCLKPDFFTSKIRQGCLPGSHSAILGPKFKPESNPNPTRRKSNRVRKPRGLHPNPPDPLLRNDGAFCWEDVQVLWEIKSREIAGINKRVEWGSLILKATEVMQYQWYRKFVLGFLVCGTDIRLFRIDRSCVLVSRSIGLDSSEKPIPTLIRCILASLVLPQTALGFPRDDFLRVVYKGDEPRLVVLAYGIELELGKQLSFPPRDKLITRGTTAHIAKQDESKGTEYCFKSSWPYRARKHEGEVLNTLQEVSGVVKLHGWDTPPDEPCLSVKWLCDKVKFVPLPQREGFSASATPMERSVSGDSVGDALSPVTDLREHRLVVTEYIPMSFIKGRTLAPLQLLRAWQGLYHTVDGIMEKNWVHRDLSWSNVRLRIVNSECSAVLIDFDLASETVGQESGAPDRTGTPAFMPLEVLDPDNVRKFRHQELHEDEMVFWVGLFTLTSCSDTNIKTLQDRLLSPELSFTAIYYAKQTIPTLTDTNWRRRFPAPPKGKTSDWDLIRTTCRKLANLHFHTINPEGYDWNYSQWDNPKELHKELLKGVDRVFDDAISRLR
ncbi:MAG: hypothetical protein M1839_008273 [Geoglossum umbratile]|nr:MAG: hypothetical protein M1839_008273 [Geoglossum umbratile]